MSLDRTMLALAEAIARVVNECAPSHVSTLIRDLCGASSIGAKFQSTSAASSTFDGVAEPLLLAWKTCPEIDTAAIALALETATITRTMASNDVELVWTGPVTDAGTTLNTTAVLFRIIRRARERLLLMSFSAFPIPGLLDELRGACERGVSVRLVLESAHESGGSLQVDAALPFVSLRDRAIFYVWPHAVRVVGASMHAKVAVADGNVALVTSANLTDRGVDSNLELGTLFEGTRLPLQIEREIDTLISRGVLLAKP